MARRLGFWAALLVCLVWIRPALAQPARELTLDEALRLAGQQDPFFERIRLEEDGAEARADLTCSQLWPVLVASGQLVRNDSEVSFGDRTVVNALDRSGRVRLSVDLFAAGNIPRCHGARLDADAAHYLRLSQERGRLFQVAQGYYAVLASERQIGIAESNIELRAAELDAAQARFDAELGLGSDVSRAAVELARAEQQLLEANRAFEDSLDAFVFILGQPEGTRYQLIVPEDFGEPARTARPIERSNELSQQAAGRRRAAPLWDLIPTLGLQGVTNFAQSSFSDPDGVSWAISLILTWTIFDGGARYAQRDLATAERAAAALDGRELVREQDFDLARTERRVHTAEARLELARQTESLAATTYEQVTLLLEQGLATGLEQSDALGTWVTAQLDLLLAQLELRLAELEAAFVAGALWPEGYGSID